MKILLAFAALLAIPYLSAMAQAPEPPPPPRMRYTEPPTTSKPASCTIGGLIEIEQCKVQEFVRTSMSVIAASDNAIRVERYDGATMLLDGATPEGDYKLRDGRTVHLRSPVGYPRHLMWSEAPRRVVYFSSSADAQLAVLVGPLSDTSVTNVGAREYYLHHYNVHRAQSNPILQPSTPYVREIPMSWYQRALVDLPPGFSSGICITWLAYERDPDLRFTKDPSPPELPPLPVSPGRLRSAAIDTTGRHSRPAANESGARARIATASILGRAVILAGENVIRVLGAPQ